MRERACRDQEYSHRFQVKWLKVVHMPFMIFDQEGLAFGFDLLNRS